MKIGDKIPDITLPDQNGKQVCLHDYIDKSNLVIYFYPKDDTPGCTKEACSFRDEYEVFKDAGAEVIGISSDSVESHKKFEQKHHLPFILLSDENKAARKAFNVPTDLLGLLPGRVTYVIDKNGIIRKIFKSQLNSEKHVTEALEMLNNF